MQSMVQHGVIISLLAFLVILPQSCLAEENSPAAIQASKVSWSELTFTGRKFSFYFRIDMQLQVLDTASGEISSVMGSEGGACPARVPGGMMLTIRAVSQGLGAEDRYQEWIRFNENDGQPSMRNRLNQGDASWMKSYCWEGQGIRRHKVVPGNSAEKKLPASAWSRHTESLYRYPGNRAGCATISDPALMVYELSSRIPKTGQNPLELCVFGKKQFHRLMVTQEQAPPLQVAYTVRSAALQETVVAQRIAPVVYAVASDNIASVNQAPETFSLFGLNRDIRIYLDPAGGIPVKISGTVDGLGTLELTVQSATLN